MTICFAAKPHPRGTEQRKWTLQGVRAAIVLDRTFPGLLGSVVRREFPPVSFGPSDRLRGGRAWHLLGPGARPPFLSQSEPKCQTGAALLQHRNHHAAHFAD